MDYNRFLKSTIYLQDVKQIYLQIVKSITLGVLRESNVFEQKVGIPKLNVQRKTGKYTFNLICNC